MKSASLALVLIFHIISFARGGNDNFPIGGRSAGMANASITFKDIWSLWQNQAGISEIKNITLGTYYEDKFLLPELSLKAFGIVIPIKDKGVVGFSYTGFGFNLYNEKKIGLAYAKSYAGHFSFGVQLDYLHTYIDEINGNHNAIAIEAGFNVRILPDLILAAHLYNPSGEKFADYDNERIPTIMKIGLGYAISDKVLGSIEAEKNVSQQINIKAGLEYKPVNKVYLRCGISTFPVSDSFGIGLELKDFKVDIAEVICQQLGSSPAISLSYKIK